MIACVSPCYSSANHTLNTLRYSDRLKEKTKRKNLKQQPNKDVYDKKQGFKDDMIFNMKGDDIDFDDKDIFLKDNIDYYDDFLVEDKIQDLETVKENANSKVRPSKPQVKQSFKPREKKPAPIEKKEEKEKEKEKEKKPQQIKEPVKETTSKFF